MDPAKQKSEGEAFLLSVDETEKTYETSVQHGLDTAQVQEKQKIFGLNKLAEAKKKTILEMFVSQFSDFLILVLLVAAIVSAFVGEVSDALLIILIVIVNAVIGVVQEKKAESSMEALKNMVVPEAKVIRNNEQIIVPSEQLVPGDVVLLDAGDYVPADGRLIEAANLKVQEAALTGESEAVDKEVVELTDKKTPIGDRKNFLYSTTIVTNGRGKMIVTETGMNSQIGRIAGMIQQAPQTKTPLQIKLNELGKTLGIGCLAICAVIFVIDLMRGQNLLETFMTAVSLAVAAIPEGLPAVVTVVLAMGTTRLVKKNAIVRKLPAVETLGAASVICSDKTGTLTQNKMTIKKVYTSEEEGIIDADQIMDNDFTPAEEVVVYSGLLCNDAKIVTDEKGVVKMGDPTEIAMLDFAASHDFIKDTVEIEQPRVDELPFDSDRKLMTTVHKLPDGHYISYTKGAPDIILSKSNRYLKGKDRAPSELDYPAREAILKENENLANDAYRVIGYGFKTFNEYPPITNEALEEDIIFGGLTGMIDPPRLEVKDAITECKKAGIKTVMITGDHVNTAKAIAKDLDIYEEGDIALTGREIDELSDEALQEKIEDISVCARVSPENKVRIVNAWQKKDAIVAMTGDGVNDAPALKAADIGCAMGKGGTEVAKEAAEMILTDDNFATIVHAVGEGRGIYDNIKKAIQFLLSSNIAEIMTIFVASLLGWAQPLLPVQILWINLITDSFPALALGVEPMDPDVMNEKPRNPKASIFSEGLGTRIILQGIMLSCISLFTYRYSEIHFGVDVARTMTFTVLACCQLAHAVNAKIGKHSLFDGKILFRNRFFWGAIILSMILQISLDLIPVMHPIFDLVDLDSKEWIFVAVASISPLIIVEISKWIEKLFKKA